MRRTFYTFRWKFVALLTMWTINECSVVLKHFWAIHLFNVSQLVWFLLSRVCTITHQSKSIWKTGTYAITLYWLESQESETVWGIRYQNVRIMYIFTEFPIFGWEKSLIPTMAWRDIPRLNSTPREILQLVFEDFIRSQSPN